MRRHVATTLAAATVVALGGDARADCSPPIWAHETPTGYRFDYFVGQAEDATMPMAAVENAMASAISSMIAHGRIDVSAVVKAKQGETLENGVRNATSDVSREVVMKGSAEAVVGLEKVETWVERCGGLQLAFVLIRLPKEKPLEPPSDGDVFTRALVPGWAQFYKGYTGWGAAFAISEVVLVSSAVALFVVSDQDYAEAGAALKQADRDFYNNRSQQEWVGAIAVTGAATVVYVYNVIDGIGAPFRNKFAEADSTEQHTRFAVLPTRDGAELAVAFNF